MIVSLCMLLTSFPAVSGPTPRNPSNSLVAAKRVEERVVWAGAKALAPVRARRKTPKDFIVAVSITEALKCCNNDAVALSSSKLTS